MKTFWCVNIKACDGHRGSSYSFFMYPVEADTLPDCDDNSLRSPEGSNVYFETKKSAFEFSEKMSREFIQ